jgi:photosystem II stability/assembly factor-like uncharacterized protein
MHRMSALTLLLAASIAQAQLWPRPLTKLEELAKFHQRVVGMQAEQRREGYERRMKMEAESPFKNLLFRNVGPEIQSGRVVDVAVPADRPSTLIVAFATGGLWRTDNMGTTWNPLFDHESAFGIGDIAIAGKDAQTLWVGTGEANSSRTSYAGTGVFKSTDGGATWKNMGLTESHHIGRVLVDPRNPDTVYVAAIGHLYSWNDDRGLFKTIDGGKSWKQVLKVNERTGAIDVAMDPRNPDVLYASTWERDRRAWNFLSSGEGTGLFKSINGGRTWKRLVRGLPTGQYVGRTGISICASSPNTVYIILDNQGIRPEAGKDDEAVPAGELTARRARSMSPKQLAAVDKEVLRRFVGGAFPQGVSIEAVIDQLRSGQMAVEQLLRHVVDPNLANIDSPRIGAQVYRSDDGGETWRLTHKARLDDVFGDYGYYFGQIGVAPDNPDKVFVLGVPLLVSEDGGKTFKSAGGSNHADNHAIWFDPRWPQRVAVGNDGGLCLSWDGGKSWQKLNNLPVGQCTTLALDSASPYRILTGLQDNGTLRGPSTFDAARNNPWDWETVGWGDGSAVQVDSRDNENILISWQFGEGMRRNLRTGESHSVQPRAQPLEEPLTYNWISPIVLSPHHQDIVYFGADRLFRSMDQGKTWTGLGQRLAGPPRGGNVPYGALVHVSESPLRFGEVYVGTDEGKVWRTLDGGVTWKDVSTGLAQGKWVSRVVASPHEPSVVYVAQSGYREDDFAPYLFRSSDKGETWVSIAEGLPNEPINVIREDPITPGLLYIGTDMGVFVSCDAGKTWEAMAGGLPHTPVHDLQVHPRDRDLVIATHGRSVYVVPVKLIQDLKQETRQSPVKLLPVPQMTASKWWGYGKRAEWDATPPDEPTLNVTYWLRSAGLATVRLKTKDGQTLLSIEAPNAAKGYNFAAIKLVVAPAKPIPEGFTPKQPTSLEELLQDPLRAFRAKYLAPGEYIVEVESGGAVSSEPFVLKPGS